MKKLSSVIVLLLISSSPLLSQIAINSNGSSPHPSAGLDVNFSNKGLLAPRMTFNQRNAIPTPAEGLFVVCTNCSTSGGPVLSVFLTGKWLNVTSVCEPPSIPISKTHIAQVNQITWNWQSAPITIGYKWNTENNYHTATDIGADTSYTESGLECFTNYTRYIWAYNGCGPSSANVLTHATTQNLFYPPPAEGTHESFLTSIVWNWDTVPGAIGYRWNDTNDADSAENMSTGTTKTETGLLCSTNYTRYAWAYDSCGNSIPTPLTQSTSICFACGDSITINHIAGNVAPVSKLVTYGTIDNIPGEPTKCWITNNLGSTHQATSVTDTTEASAGWYWQFNHMQGYKHNGLERIPNTTWITSISQLSDWISDQDPCILELGDGWRIPTSAEWNNVDLYGSWGNWNGPWGSNLKMHAAGRLNQATGVLEKRAENGNYWSSTAYSTVLGVSLYFFNSGCSPGPNPKTLGYSVRCIKN